MSEAEEHGTERTRNVVILPPDTGDRDVPTDEEDFAGDEEDLHEPAGEIELEESSEDEEDEESIQAPRWRKHTDIQSDSEGIPPASLTACGCEIRWGGSRRGVHYSEPLRGVWKKYTFNV